MSSTPTITRPRATKVYKELLALGVPDETALNSMGFTVDLKPFVDAPAEVAEVSEVDASTARLLEAGFTEEQIRTLTTPKAKPVETKAERKVRKAAKKAAKAKKATATAPAPELTNKERAEALVAQHALAFTRGRVYGGVSLAEAIVRVHRTGTAEIVTSSGVGRVAAVLVYREDSGDVALQNLSRPS